MPQPPLRHEHDHAAAARKSAMVVAESPVNRLVVGRIAAQSGMRVIETTPTDALAQFRANSPFLVILDCGSGLTTKFDGLIEAIRLRERSADLKVIMIHGRNHGHDDGVPADARVAAPVTSDSLLPVIRHTTGL